MTSMDNSEVYVYRQSIIRVNWSQFEEVYHWYVFVAGEEAGDSLKSCGYEREEEALFYAKQHADWILEDSEQEHWGGQNGDRP